MYQLIKRAYSAYYFHFPHYMLTKNEAFFLHTFIVLFTLLFSYGVFAFLPSYFAFAVSRSYYYLTGDNNQPISS